MIEIKIGKAFLIPLLAALILGNAARSGNAQESLPEPALELLKSATVFVKVLRDGREGSGSGFLFRTEGQVGFVVTNEHVVRGNAKSPSVVSIVLYSGTARERSVPASVLAADENKDLAIIKIQASVLPKPIVPTSQPKLRETLPVYIFGFPFGEALTLRKGNPAITIGKGWISSIRNTDAGDILQIDGDVNPGNSGGPITDSSGSVIGVAVAKVGGTQIAFAIPYDEVRKFLSCRVAGVIFDKIPTFRDNELKFRAQANLIDPIGNLKSISILLIPAIQVKVPPRAGANQQWSQADPAMAEFPLRIQGKSTAVGEITMPAEKKISMYLYQTRVIRSDGSVLYSEPGRFNADLPNQGATTIQPAQNQLFSGAGVSTSAPLAVDKPDGWLGAQSAVGAGLSIKGYPLSVPGDQIFLKEQKKLLNAVVSSLSIEKEVAPCPRFTPDGKSIYLIETEGVVRKLRVPSFQEERRLSTGQKLSWLEPSKEGLLLTLAPLQETWILDPDTLSIKGRIPTPGVGRISSAPSLSLGFAAINDGRDLMVLDLIKMQTVQRINANKIRTEFGSSIRKHKEGIPLAEFRNVLATPDGKYLLSSGFDCLHRFQIQEREIVYEEVGPRIGTCPVSISPDSIYVASCGRIFRTSDFQYPVVNLDRQSRMNATAFDKTAGVIYGHDTDYQLIAFNSRGAVKNEYALTGRGDETRAYAVHPNGNRLIAVTEKNVFWIEFQKTQ